MQFGGAHDVRRLDLKIKGCCRSINTGFRRRRNGGDEDDREQENHDGPAVLSDNDPVITKVNSLCFLEQEIPIVCRAQLGGGRMGERKPIHTTCSGSSRCLSYRGG